MLKSFSIALALLECRCEAAADSVFPKGKIYQGEDMIALGTLGIYGRRGKTEREEIYDSSSESSKSWKANVAACCSSCVA